MVVKENDVLDNCIIDMFGETEELENTELSIHDDYTGIPGIIPKRVNTGDHNQDSRNTIITVNKISPGNVFIQGRAKIIGMKMPEG